MSAEGKRVAIYARVSTADQTTENQMLDLRRYCASSGWEVVEVFTDAGISGAKEIRPALQRLMEAVHKRRVDRVLVWRFDRFARSVSHLVSTLAELRKRGVSFTSYMDKVETDTPQGEFFFHIMAALAQFERDLIRERIHSGLRRARSQGKHLGRPGLPAAKRSEIIGLRGTASIRQIAARVGVGRSVVHKVLSVKPVENVASPIDDMPVAF